jgi:DNA polymerase-3 subunit chi
MTEIAFHFHVPDKLGYACRFVRKHFRGDSQLAIIAAPDVLDQFDRMLWNVSASDFVAHCRADSSAEMLEASRIVLLLPHQMPLHRQVLLNLGDDVPPVFEAFEKVVEVVSASDASDRRLARRRWKHYADKGFALVQHDLSQKGT